MSEYPTEPCGWCGKPVTVISVSEREHKVYHGSCYRKTLPHTTDDVPGVVTLYSHDDKVRDGIEQP